MARFEKLQKLIGKLQNKLDSQSDAKTKAWNEKYLKGVISFRGLKTQPTRTCLNQWWKEEVEKETSVDEQKDLAFLLIEEKYSEDKLSGILILQEKIFPHLQKEDLVRLEKSFDKGHIYDWSTCDWVCIRVLQKFAENNPENTKHIASWRTAENLWRKRASCVAFVNLAKKGDNFFPGFTDLLLQVCGTVVQSKERFHQTGTGWLLRQISVIEPKAVSLFIETNYSYFSREGLRYALEKMSQKEKNRLSNYDQEQSNSVQTKKKRKM